MIGVAGDSRHPGSHTRVCSEMLLAPSQDRLLEALGEIGRRADQPPVLYPCTDLSVLAISRHRAMLSEHFRFALPDPDIVEMMADKVRFYEYAEGAGLPIPRTLVLAERSDALDAAEALAFPAILKPAMRTSGWEARTIAKAYRASGPQEFLALYDRIAAWTDTLIGQEWVEGSDDELISCNCYFDAESKPLVTFIARKIRQWPPEMGTSSLGEECRDDEVLQESLRLFEGVRLRGFGYLEMKRDARSGRLLIIEPNIGRPTGRSAIAEAGGVELLYAQYCDLLGLPRPEGLEQGYTGVKWLDLQRDVRSALHYWRRGRLSLRDWRRSLSGRKAHAVFSWKDPLPFWFDLWKSAPKAIRWALGSARREGRPPL